MNNLTYLLALARALKAVEDPSPSDRFRSMQRWYSERYHVDITRIDSVPDEEILQAWWENWFMSRKTSSDPKDLEQYESLKRSILFADQEEEEAQDDDDWEREMLEEIRREQGQDEAATQPNLSDTSDHLELSGDNDYYVPEDE